MMKNSLLLLANSFIVLSSLLFSCDGKPPGVKCTCTLDPHSIDSVSSEQRELDYFYSLMAYAVVYKDWQKNAKKRRGYNIGSVLVDSNKFVVNWARNSVDITGDESQHGEVRLMQSYLEKTRAFALRGALIYTTLEPCAMCSGMMKMTQLHRTVYGQTDPRFGKALERLQLESASCCTGGYSPYPRAVISDKSPDPISLKIDSAYAQYQGKSIVSFLFTPQAETLFLKATDMFISYKTAKYAENQPYIDQAHLFYNTVVPPVAER